MINNSSLISSALSKISSKIIKTNFTEILLILFFLAGCSLVVWARFSPDPIIRFVENWKIEIVGYTLSFGPFLIALAKAETLNKNTQWFLGFIVSVVGLFGIGPTYTKHIILQPHIENNIPSNLRVHVDSLLGEKSYDGLTKDLSLQELIELIETIDRKGNKTDLTENNEILVKLNSNIVSFNESLNNYSVNESMVTSNFPVLMGELKSIEFTLKKNLIFNCLLVERLTYLTNRTNKTARLEMELNEVKKRMNNLYQLQLDLEERNGFESLYYLFAGYEIKQDAPSLPDFTVSQESIPSVDCNDISSFSSFERQFANAPR